MARPCSVCKHPAVDRINEKLVRSAPQDTVVREFGLDRQAVHRHTLRHLPRLLSLAERARELANASHLLERIQELIDDLDKIRRGAEEPTLRLRAIEALAARFEFLLKVGVEVTLRRQEEAPLDAETESRMMRAYLLSHPEIIEEYLARQRALPPAEVKNAAI